VKATFSPCTGYCAFDHETDEYRVVDVSTSEDTTDIPHSLLRNINDWITIEAQEFSDVLTECKRLYYWQRAMIDAETCLLPIETPLCIELLTRIETSLRDYITMDDAQWALLCAPLINPDRATDLARLSIANGLNATALLFSTIVDHQPHLRRVASHWLELPVQLFEKLDGERSLLWISAARKGVIRQSLEANDSGSFRQRWQSLAFSEVNPGRRLAILEIASVLTGMIFPNVNDRPSDSKLAAERVADEALDNRKLTRKSQARSYREQLSSALRQIETVTQLVSEGEDAKAKLFLRELVDAQTENEDDTKHAVKSLCNVAQQCSELFRTDFEYECLSTANALDPSDIWTKVQLANHYKSIGAFDKAIGLLWELLSTTSLEVVQKSLADAHSRMGKFNEAIEIYHQIPNWQDSADVRVMLANIRRKQGEYDLAEAELNAVANDDEYWRVLASRAEIARHRGLLDSAEALYRQAIEAVSANEQSRLYYEVSLANVLKARGEFEAAFRILDRVRIARPFWMRVRVSVAAVSGLLGRADLAILELPVRKGSRAFNEWVYQYVRGALLMQLERFDEATQELELNWSIGSYDRDADTMLRLASAVSLLRRQSGVPKAKATLTKIVDNDDEIARYFRLALEYHIAVAEKNRQQIARLASQLSRIGFRPILSIVEAIDRHDWRAVSRLQIQLLLRMAA